MKRTAAFALGLILIGPQAASAAADPAARAQAAFFTALQKRANVLGSCEKHRDKAELEELAAFLARPDDQSTALGRNMIAETRKAFEAGRAAAASRAWTADQCEQAITGALQEAAAAMAEVERIEAAQAK